MKDGFLKVAAVTPDIKVADPIYNMEQLVKSVTGAASLGAKVIVTPELAMCGYTCSDLFWQEALIRSSRAQLAAFVAETRSIDALIFVGLPFEHENKLYNVAAAVCHGDVLGIVPKKHLPTYNEFYESRHFTPASDEIACTSFDGREIPFGTDLLFSCASLPHLTVAAEICEDLWVTSPPSVRHAEAGATVIVNLSASDEAAGKDAYRRELVRMHSARLICGYVYAAAGTGESTTDLVFGAQNMVDENGVILAEAERFKNAPAVTELDLDRIVSERRRMTTFPAADNRGFVTVPFDLNLEETPLTRTFGKMPFVPSSSVDRGQRCDEILMMQSMGLAKRLSHINCRAAVIGISGGLDSTLALVVTARAFDICGLPRSGILSVTMPCFGTTSRTHDNACRLTERIGATLREIPISDAVRVHFRDIGHDENEHDVTYENCQARERTQVLMDLANKTGGIVIGTGDLSELALGWATYNGDHMSMYAPNVSVPKTLVRHLLAYYADTCGDSALAETIRDILNTPVSPELLPPENGIISQKTEDLVGPYELHDFFLYYMLRAMFPPKKLYRVACRAFEGDFSPEEILHWMKVFYRRFFAQQFKRSCLPDGPKVGSVAVSPRGDLRMPSDACARIWLDELENL